MAKSRLLKDRIIKSAAHFEEIFSQGKKLHSKHLLLVFLPADSTKVGFAVSGKIKGAVVRNRAKRRLRELYRLNQERLSENTHFILLAKPGIENAGFAELEKELLALFRKVSATVK